MEMTAFYAVAGTLFGACILAFIGAFIYAIITANGDDDFYNDINEKDYYGTNENEEAN